MNNNINLLNAINLLQFNSLSGLVNSNNLNSNGLNSNNSSSFDIMLLSLLNSMSVSNQSANVSFNNQVSNILDQTLDTLNKIQNIQNGLGTQSELSDKDSRIENAIKSSSQKYGVDEKLINSIIKVESNFNPDVVSSAGAKGLMQLMPENCKDLGVTDPFNIEQNIDGGVRHIKEYIDKYDGDIKMALMAYNGGPTRMANRGVRSIDDIYKMPKETQNYVSKVMKNYNT